MDINIYIYIYMYKKRERERAKERAGSWAKHLQRGILSQASWAKASSAKASWAKHFEAKHLGGARRIRPAPPASPAQLARPPRPPDSPDPLGKKKHAIRARARARAQVFFSARCLELKIKKRKKCCARNIFLVKFWKKNAKRKKK